MLGLEEYPNICSDWGKVRILAITGGLGFYKGENRKSRKCPKTVISKETGVICTMLYNREAGQIWAG